MKQHAKYWSGVYQAWKEELKNVCVFPVILSIVDVCLHLKLETSCSSDCSHSAHDVSTANGTCREREGEKKREREMEEGEKGLVFGQCPHVVQKGAQEEYFISSQWHLGTLIGNSQDSALGYEFEASAHPSFALPGKQWEWESAEKLVWFFIKTHTAGWHADAAKPRATLMRWSGVDIAEFCPKERWVWLTFKPPS